MDGIVLFTQRVEIVESYNERRDCADQRISDFISICGYIPIPIPNSIIVVNKLLKNIVPKGIVLTGGNSLVKYGGNAPERDEVDRLLIEYAVERKIPLYGFCRGMQSILDYFGNKLVKVDGHIAVRHIVTDGDVLEEVNSYHGQACIEILSNELEVVFQAEDGVIESVKHVSLPIMATMWHPEREAPYKHRDVRAVQELFKGLSNEK